MPRRMEASLSRGNWFQATGVPGSGVEKGILGCSRNRQTEEKLWGQRLAGSPIVAQAPLHLSPASHTSFHICPGATMDFIQITP